MPYSETKKQNAVAALDAGQTLRTVAKRFKVHPNTVSTWRKVLKGRIAAKTYQENAHPAAATPPTHQTAMEALKDENIRLKLIIFNTVIGPSLGDPGVTSPMLRS